MTLHKKFLTTLLLSSTFAFTGCASLSLYERYNPTDSKTIEKQLGSDEMIAIGQSIKSENPHLNDGVVFIGKQYTYLVTDGAEPFLALIQEFPANKLVLESEVPIKFNFIDKVNFQNSITFSYADPVEKIPDPLLQRLKQLGFKTWKTNINAAGQSETYLHNQFNYRGQLYRPLNAAQVQHQFSKAYPITLLQKQTKESVNVGNIASSIILAPLALSFDIITSPIWGSFVIACQSKNCFQ